MNNLISTLQQTNYYRYYNSLLHAIFNKIITNSKKLVHRLRLKCHNRTESFIKWRSEKTQQKNNAKVCHWNSSQCANKYVYFSKQE